MPYSWPERTSHAFPVLALSAASPDVGQSAPARQAAVLLTRDGPPGVDGLCRWSVTRCGPSAVFFAADLARNLGTVLQEGPGWLLASMRGVACGTPEHGEAVDLDALDPSGIAVLQEFLPGDTVILAVPVRTFPVLAERLPGKEAVALGEPAASLLAGHLRTLARILPTVRPSGIPLLVEATGTLLEACLDCGQLPLRRADREPLMGPRARVDRVIRENLASARLDTRRICELSGISRSVLYRLFEESGGVAAYVRALRLALVREDLADPALAHLPIARLAEQRGLHCTPSFNRAFRRAFGCTPGAVRNEALTGASRLVETDRSRFVS